MAEENWFKRMRANLPDNFWRFLIVGFVIYSFVIVGKVIFDNWKQNKMIDRERSDVVALSEEIIELKLNIVYFKTNTYKEKIARGKLRYALPGETVVSVPYDPTTINQTKTDASPAVISRPNYVYWGLYFFGNN